MVLTSAARGNNNDNNEQQQQRTTTTTTTTTTDDDDDDDDRYMRKNFRCNGAVVKSKEGDEIILLQGNQGDNVISFMVDMNICKKEQVIRKGI